MSEGASTTVQELVKITDCSWQLCAQALQASGEDPQRAIQMLMQHKQQGNDGFIPTSGGLGLPGALPGALPLPGTDARHARTRAQQQQQHSRTARRNTRAFMRRSVRTSPPPVRARARPYEG